jgi:hypothetical protein
MKDTTNSFFFIIIQKLLAPGCENVEKKKGDNALRILFSTCLFYCICVRIDLNIECLISSRNVYNSLTYNIISILNACLDLFINFIYHEIDKNLY